MSATPNNNTRTQTHDVIQNLDIMRTAFVELIPKKKQQTSREVQQQHQLQQVRGISDKGRH